MNQKVFIAEAIAFNLIESEADAVYKLMKKNRFEENSEGIKQFLLSKAFNKNNKREAEDEDIEKGIQFIKENPQAVEKMKQMAILAVQKMFKAK